MNRARKSDNSKAGNAKNSLVPKTKGGNMAKPVKNSIAVRPGTNSSSKIANSIALCGKH